MIALGTISFIPRYLWPKTQSFEESLYRYIHDLAYIGVDEIAVPIIDKHVRYYIEPLIAENLVRVDFEGIICANPELLEKELDRIDITSITNTEVKKSINIVHSLGLRSSLWIVGPLTIASTIYVKTNNQRESLLRYPNKASALLWYVKKIVETVCSLGIDKAIVYEPALCEISKESEFRFGYKKEYIIEMYEFLVEENCCQSLYIFGNTTPMLLETIAKISTLEEVGLSFVTTPRNTTLTILSILRHSGKKIRAGLISRNLDSIEIDSVIEDRLNYLLSQGIKVVSILPEGPIYTRVVHGDLYSNYLRKFIEARKALKKLGTTWS